MLEGGRLSTKHIYDDNDVNNDVQLQGRVAIFERMQCISHVAISDRNRREAAESGRRQREEIALHAVKEPP